MIARLVRRASAVGALLVLAGCAASPSPAYEVTAVECASAAVPRPDDRAFTPLGDEILTMTGWSHTSPAETSLALEHTRYGLRRSAFLPDPTCADRSTLEIVLVKRLVDWDRQHVNGLEATWPTRSVRFSDVTDVTLVLRLLPGLSSIPGPEALAEHFAGVLEPEQVHELDGGKVNLELTLFGEPANAERPFLNAGTIIEIDPDAHPDGWVRVTVPLEAFEAYTEVAYQRSPSSLEEHPGLFVRGLRVNPESASGRTLRHVQLDDFEPGATPELFKEMALQLALVEVGHAPASG